MDFFPFRPYYYPQNRYVPYGNIQNRGINQGYQGQRKGRQTASYGEKQEKSDYREEINSQSRKIDRDIPKLDKSEEPLFEIFGLKLFFDDVLIISLIFFLYNEGVRDNLLFISLILILLS